VSDLNGHRDGNGRFAPGNPGGPGRPRRAVEQDYLIAASQAVSPERFQRIAERAAEDAEKGDPRARQWLSDLLLGRRATTSMALTVTEEQDEPNFRVLTDEEFSAFSIIYDNIRSDNELSADDAQAFGRLTAKTLASPERTGDVFDYEGDD
jgi:hypothetical protein